MCVRYRALFSQNVRIINISYNWSFCHGAYSKLFTDGLETQQCKPRIPSFVGNKVRFHLETQNKHPPHTHTHAQVHTCTHPHACLTHTHTYTHAHARMQYEVLLLIAYSCWQLCSVKHLYVFTVLLTLKLPLKCRFIIPQAKVVAYILCFTLKSLV